MIYCSGGDMIKDMNDEKHEKCYEWVGIVRVYLRYFILITLLILLLLVTVFYFPDFSRHDERFIESSSVSFYTDSICSKYCLTPDMFIRFRDYLYNSDFEGEGVYRLKFKDVEEVSQSIGSGSVYDEVYSSDVAGWVIRSFIDKGYTELESYALYVYGNTDSIESRYFMRYISGGYYGE